MENWTGFTDWNLDNFSNSELGHWLKQLKAEPLRDAETEKVTAELIGQIQDELAARHANVLDAIHVQGQRR